MSGTTSLCLQQQWNNTTGEPLVGGLLYSYQAGTLNPQNAYRTAALTVGTEFSNPVVLDASARVPLMFYADGLIRLILTDKNGIAQFDYDNVPIIGSSGGGGAVDTTDPTRLFSTGFMMLKYGTGQITGYVRGNGLSIGSLLSPATEYKSDTDAQALFQYFWNNDPSLVVSGGRGANANADWLLNKAINTPDFRGYVIGGLDGMGNTRASRLSLPGWDSLGGAYGGGESHTLVLGEIPIHNHPVTEIPNVGGHDHNEHSPELTNAGGVPLGSPAPGTLLQSMNRRTSFDGIHSHGTATSNVGGGGTHNNIQPTRLVTVYFRL